jgi:very-short-patch-repair endonuclease
MMLTFIDKQKTVCNRVRALREKATFSEIRIQNLLESIGVRYIFQKGFIQGNYYCIVDFYLPNYKLCIEVDGLYHSNQDQIIKDKVRDRYLVNDRHFKVLRITNELANRITSDQLLKLIKQTQAN